MPRNAIASLRGRDNSGPMITLIYHDRRRNVVNMSYHTSSFACVDDALTYYRHNYPQYAWERGYYQATGWDDSPRYTNPSNDERRKLQRKVYSLRSSAKRGMVNAK